MFFSAIRKKKNAFILWLFPLLFSLFLLTYLYLFRQTSVDLQNIIFLGIGLLLFFISAWKPAIYLLYSFLFALIIFYYQPYSSWGNNDNHWEIICGSEIEQRISLRFDRLTEDYSLQGQEILIDVQGYRTNPMLFFLPPLKEEPLRIQSVQPSIQPLFPGPISRRLPLGIESYRRELDSVPYVPYYRYTLAPGSGGRYNITD